MTLGRIKKLSLSLKSGEAAIITGDANRIYLTGFKSSAGAVVVMREKAYFLIDFRYFEKAKTVVNSCEVILCNKFFEQANLLFGEQKINTVYVETSVLSVSEFMNYKERFGKTEISNDKKIDTILREMRSIKSKDEIELIKKAQRLTDKTFRHILDFIKPGVTEKEIMLEMEFFIRRLGSEGVSFDFIVVSGKNSSLPHGVPTDKKIQNGDFITMDFGAVVGGYRSDMTRTVAVGYASDEMKNIYNIVLKAQKAAIDKMNPGEFCCEVDKAARDVITAAGYGDCFGHALGHSVGIEIHESPACNLSCNEVMKPGIVMTAEPGIYIENKFGVRIEDMIIITENGHEDITESVRDLIIL